MLSTPSLALLDLSLWISLNIIPRIFFAAIVGCAASSGSQGRTIFSHVKIVLGKISRTLPRNFNALLNHIATAHSCETKNFTLSECGNFSGDATEAFRKWASMGWGVRRLGLHTRDSFTKVALSLGGNPVGHTDTRLVYLSIVNPMLDLERKAEGAAGPEKFIVRVI